VIDWDDCRVFLAVARAGTLSAAARRLGVDQSTVGRRLSALEEATSARLFDRTPEGFLLTASGEAMLQDAEGIEASVDRIERRLMGQDARPEGVVRLATSDSLAAWFLIPRLPAFHARQPKVEIELVTGTPAVDLARREADISLRLSKPAQPNLIARCVGSAEWAVYGSKAYFKSNGRPIVGEELGAHTVVGFDEQLKSTLGARWLAANAARSPVALRSNSLLTIAAGVVAGLGLSPLPCLFGECEPALDRAFDATIGAHEIWLVVHPDVRTSARVRAVIDFLCEVVNAEVALLTGRNAQKAKVQPKRKARARAVIRRQR
jgi:DNA-binding transcriptional LysR family regulator